MLKTARTGRQTLLHGGDHDGHRDLISIGHIILFGWVFGKKGMIE
jgi:hypothetical protein